MRAGPRLPERRHVPHVYAVEHLRLQGRADAGLLHVDLRLPRHADVHGRPEVGQLRRQRTLHLQGRRSLPSARATRCPDLPEQPVEQPGGVREPNVLRRLVARSNCSPGEQPTACSGQTALTSCNATTFDWNTTNCASPEPDVHLGIVSGRVHGGGIPRACSSGIEGCGGTQTCQANGTWDACSPTGCAPFSIAAGPRWSCSNLCSGASCNFSYNFSCPGGTTPVGCNANCVSGACTSGNGGSGGAHWSTTLTGVVSNTGACGMHVGTTGATWHDPLRQPRLRRGPEAS